MDVETFSSKNSRRVNAFHAHIPFLYPPEYVRNVSDVLRRIEIGHWHEMCLITLIMAVISIYPFQILHCMKINSFVFQPFPKVFLDDLRD